MEYQQRSASEIRIPERVLEGDFRGWLRDAMARRRISQRLLADRSGVDHSTISRLLSDDRVPSLTTALALLRVLERPILVLADDGDDVLRREVG